MAGAKCRASGSLALRGTVGQRFAPLQGENEAHAVSHTLRSSRTSISRRQSLKGLLILAATGLSGWVAWRSTPLPDAVERLSADLSTGTGETREATLSDGSRIWLNALSALNVRFDTTQRLLQLRVGEVLIETAKDAGRAFLVDTAHGRMQALGTRFSVRQDDRQTWLNVYEGAVQVRNRRDQVEVVPAGRQLVFSAGHLGTQRRPIRPAKPGARVCCWPITCRWAN